MKKNIMEEELLDIINLHTALCLTLDSLQDIYKNQKSAKEINPTETQKNMAFLIATLNEINERKSTIARLGLEDEFQEITFEIWELIELIKTYHKED